MKPDKFCFQCGGRLHYFEDNLECSSCGAAYYNLLISETEFTEGRDRLLEIGVCLNITVKTPVEPIETPEPLQVIAAPQPFELEKITA